jgi:hypothetical protein
MRGFHVVALAIAGCSSAAPAAPAGLVAPSSSTSAPSARSCKPEAPITVTLEATPIDARRSAVAVTAVPTRGITGLEIELVTPSALTLVDGAGKLRFGAIAAGEMRTLTATVRLDGRSGDLAAVARVPVDGVMMARTAFVHVGEPVAPTRTHTYALPDGEMAREVRP